MNDTRLKLMEAIARRRMVTAQYNGNRMTLAPHRMFERRAARSFLGRKASPAEVLGPSAVLLMPRMNSVPRSAPCHRCRRWVMVRCTTKRVCDTPSHERHPTETDGSHCAPANGHGPI